MIRRSADLEDDPINPEDVRSGDPRARALGWAVSADQTTTHWLWECTAGSFRRWFGFDETVPRSMAYGSRVLGQRKYAR
jgi:uncharacterized cupin superfamily protein